MRSILVLCIGTLKEKYLKEAVAEYQKRLGAYCKLKIVELSEEKVSQSPTEAEIKNAIECEGARIISKIPPGAYVATLCIEGEKMSSPEFSRRIDGILTDITANELVFIIGGSWGLSEKVKALSRLRLSFSPMTFTHQISRMLLLEQLYRAFQISSGGKYHK